MLRKWIGAVILFLLLGMLASAGQPLAHLAEAQGTGCQAFPETGKTVCAIFLQYWNTHGGLAQQGYPISDVLGEVSATDGKTYTVQYFERAEFEYHPENKPPNDVLLTLLGAQRYSARYPGGAPSQAASNDPGSTLFPETGKRVGGGFLDYWQSHGGLAQQGYPISDEFTEVSDLDGKSYVVQYFERAEFEYHPENPASSRILLAQLGTFRHRDQQSKGGWVTPPQQVPQATSAPAPPPQPAPTSTATARPAPTPPAPQPSPTTPVQTGERCGAICMDGTESQATGQGACSHHGGVREWKYCDLLPPSGR